MEITTYTLPINHLPEQDGAPIAQLRHEMTELVPGISHGNGFRGFWHATTGQHFEPFRPGKPRWIQAKFKR